MFAEIKANEIDSWAKSNSRSAQKNLPALISRLILATSPKARIDSVQLEDGIQHSGYDLVSYSEEDTALVSYSEKDTNFFSSGKTVWEFSIEDNAEHKFREDIKKRSENPLGVNTKETTFVFATLKSWKHKKSIEELINESKLEYQWKHIRIVDAAQITLWLEHCPGVLVWMCEQMGKHVPGVLSVEKYWTERCITTSPVLVEEFFLLEREEEIESLSEWLKNDKDCGGRDRVLRAESSLEATLFIVSVILNLSESLKKEFNGLKNKVVIVTTSGAWDDIVSRQIHKKDVIFIPTFEPTEATRNPCDIYAITPMGKALGSSTISKEIKEIEIPKRTRGSFSRALESLGYSSSDAHDITTKTKRSFPALYRMITKKLIAPPKWTALDNPRELIPALLLGRWNGTYAGDREMVEKISEVSYDEYVKKLVKWTSIEDAPLLFVPEGGRTPICGAYQIVSMPDSWEFLFSQLTSFDIHALKECVKAVFGVGDSSLDLSERQQFVAPMRSKSYGCSEYLQEGIIISLIMLAQHDSKVNCIPSTRVFVDSLVADVLGEVKSGQQLRAIAPWLPLLAEASPKAVLEKIEKEVGDNGSNLWDLFAPSEDFLTRDDYVDLLWALEVLVWYEPFAVRSILVLARICEKKFEYKIANSPQSTLFEIFCPWYPQSCLSKEERIRLLKQICHSSPYTSQLLLRSLSPIAYSICGQIQRPMWSTVEIESPSKAPEAEYNEVVSEIIDLILDLPTNNTEHWETIVSNIRFYENRFEELREKCVSFCKSVGEEEANKIACYLREQIWIFRKFKDSKRNASEEFISKLEQLLVEIEPDSILKYQYLFTRYPYLLHPISCDEENNSDYEKEKGMIFEARSKAVDEIIEEFGVDALVDFCSKIEDWTPLAEILADRFLGYSYNYNILTQIKRSDYQLYVSILRVLFSHNGLETLVDTLKAEKSLSDAEKGEALLHNPLSDAISPLSSSLWAKLETFNKTTVDYYWKYIRAVRLDDSEASEYYLLKLLEYKRPFTAAQIVAYSVFENSEIIMRILEQLDCLKEHKEETGMSFAAIESHRILKLFEKIYDNNNIDEFAVARLEVKFLDFFDFDFKPKCLHNHLQENPKKFVDLISKCWRLDISSERARSRSSEEETQARRASKILFGFNSIPGCNDRLVSTDKFNDWVAVAREYADSLPDSLRCSEGFEFYLEKLLAHSPVGADGIFPHEIVRVFLEKNGNESMIESFLLEKTNQRGWYKLSGGKEEKEIADGYSSDARKLRTDFPKTSAILDKLGDFYKEESRIEQQRELLDYQIR